MLLLSYLKTLPGVLSIQSILRTPSNCENVVDLDYAHYQGQFDGTTNITSFIGVRYAAAPTDSLRWRAPQPPVHVSGLQQAKTQAKQCHQGSAGAGFPWQQPFSNKEKDEDCLFLNVFIPGNVSPTASLPVVVWIHGGGYVADITGSADADGGDLIRAAGGGVIVVVIQHRLGLFGFLPGARVKESGALNAGLLDQRFALQWIQDHITTFGGDRSKVTMWGESAGAGAVLQHVVANGGKTDPPLFRAAITSSSYLPVQHNYNHRVPEQLYAKVVDLTNCTASEDSLSCLRATDASTLAYVNDQVSLSAFFGTTIFGPVIDGDYIIEHPIETLRKGHVNGDVLLTVTNSFEGRPFVNSSTSDLPTFVSDVFPTFDPEQVNAAVEEYRSIGENTLDQAIAIMGESIFICPTYFLLDAFGMRGYKGEYAVPPANHGEDMGVYFPSTRPAFTANTTFLRSFSQSFLAVVISLDPNSRLDTAYPTLQWAGWNLEPTEMLFNVTEEDYAMIHPIRTDPGLLARCRFWQNAFSSPPHSAVTS